MILSDSKILPLLVVTVLTVIFKVKEWYLGNAIGITYNIMLEFLCKYLFSLTLKQVL